MSVRWLAASYDGPALSARVGRDGDRLIAEWPGRARLTVRRDGSEAVFEPEGGDPISAEKLRRGAAQLLLSHLSGGVPLHGSAVALGGRAVALVGGTGHGKSTLAATLCESFGAALLADDAVAIEERQGAHVVLPLEDQHWLDRGAAHLLGREVVSTLDKEPIAARLVGGAAVPLVLIAHLAFTDVPRPRLVAVEGLEAVSGLLAQLTRFVVDEPEVARRDLTALADLVARVRVVRLERPRALTLLRESAEAVVAALHAGHPGSP